MVTGLIFGKLGGFIRWLTGKTEENLVEKMDTSTHFLPLLDINLILLITLMHWELEKCQRCL